MIYNNTSLVSKSNFVATIASYLHVFYKYSIKKYTHFPCVEVTLNWQTKVT